MPAPSANWQGLGFYKSSVMRVLCSMSPQGFYYKGSIRVLEGFYKDSIKAL